MWKAGLEIIQVYTGYLALVMTGQKEIKSI